MFIPFPVIALPQIKLTATVGLDNPLGVAILHILFALSFNVLLYSAFLRSIPLELEESCRMDGCSTWQVFCKLILPLLAPMNATVAIFAFLGSWNDFMMPSLITSNPHQQTLPVVQNLLPGAVQHQLQRGLRLVPDGDAAEPDRLPCRPALGDVRPDAGSHQVDRGAAARGPSRLRAAGEAAP